MSFIQQDLRICTKSAIRNLSNNEISQVKRFCTIDNGISTYWEYDSTDTTSVDDDVDVLVTTSLKRIKRQLSSPKYLKLLSQSKTKIPTPTNGVNVYSNISNLFGWKSTNGFFTNLDSSNLSDDRVFILPNLDGTFALISDLTSKAGLSVNNIYSGTNTFNARLQSSDFIGDLASISTLSVVDNFQFNHSTVGAGKFLTTDANGNTSWSDLPSSIYDRANHTGTQAISTVTGLQSSLNGKASLSSMNAFLGINTFPLIGLTAQANVNIFTPSGGVALYSNSSNQFGWKSTNGFFVNFINGSNTADRVYTLPDSTGTIALISDLATKQNTLNGTGFVKSVGGTISYDNSTYLTGITSSNVTTALGYIPYNATNPSGYITNSALTPYGLLAGTQTWSGNNYFNNNVGIGTSSPSSKLNVKSTASTTVPVLQIESSGTLANNDIVRFQINGLSNGFRMFQNASSIINYTFEDGNVGIGTTNPVTKLDVNGGINTNSYFLLNGSAFANWDGSANRIYSRNGTPAISIGTNNVTAYDNLYHVFRKPDGTEKFAIDGTNNMLYSYVTKHLFGSQTDDGTANQFAGAVRVKNSITIDNDILIKGGNSVNAGFITANSSGGGLYFASYGTNQNIRFVPSGTGYNHFVNNTYFADNVGVGITTPYSKLHVNNSTAINTWITTGHVNGGTIFGHNADNEGIIGGYSATNLKFGYNVASTFVETMRLNATGNLGIGTSSPSQKLDVNGNITSNGAILAGTSYQLNGQYLAYPSSGSNTVNGRVINNSSGTDGMYIGYGNGSNAMNRIFDGTGTNYVGIGSSTFSSSGINKWLFGNQTDDGTFAQFSGAVKMKSSLTVTGDIVANGNMNLNNNNWQYWKDNGGYSRRVLGVTANNLYFGDIDNIMAGSQVVFAAKDNATFYLNGSEKVRIQNDGRVGIGTNSPVGILDVTSTTSPSYPLPRMTTTQINAITGMSQGAMVYNTTISCPCFYDGTAWKRLSHSAM